MLPAYSFLLGLIALLGYVALASGVVAKNPNEAIPLLFLGSFPEWFAGFCLAAIAVGALVPAAIMSIAASNLFTRNLYGEFARGETDGGGGGFNGEGGFAGGEVWGAGICVEAACDVCDRDAVTGGNLDLPDGSGGGWGFVYAVVSSLGLVGRVGGGDGGGDGDGLVDGVEGVCLSLAFIWAGVCDVCGGSGAVVKSDCGGGVDGDIAGGEGGGGSGCDGCGGLCGGSGDNFVGVGAS